MKILTLLWCLAVMPSARAVENSAWVERLAFWATSELKSLDQQTGIIDGKLSKLAIPASVNSGNRIGYQSAGKADNEDLWVELEFPEPVHADSVTMVPLLAKGSNGQVPGFGFPERFLLDGVDGDGEKVMLMDESTDLFPNPKSYPVTAAVPPGVLLKKIRLTAIEPWSNNGPPVLALSEILVLAGNRNIAWTAKVIASSSREIQPSWSRYNLIDMTTPLGLPLAPDGSRVMGWHGAIATSINEKQSVTVDLGKPSQIDEVRLAPARRTDMAWNSNYGFPIRFVIESSLDQSFANPVTIHDQTNVSLQSPGQNFQIYNCDVSARYIRVTASRLRDLNGDFIFALGELQAYAGDVDVAAGAAVMASASLTNGEWNPAGLTDGHSKGGRLLELPEWIRQLEQRRLLEMERKQTVQRRGRLFTQAEHTLVTTSVCGASGIALMAGLFSWRGHRQRVLDRERHRERLARDLHDELGSNLGSIALISSLAGLEDVDQMRLDLAEIEIVARESADSMRDMVSLLAAKRGGDSDNWLNVMTGLAERLMRGVELECRLPTTPLIWEPNIETRRELYLFCKEVLHNAAKHGHPRHLKFHLGPTADGLRIEIADDGGGFSTENAEGGHGLGNLRERASVMRGEMTIISTSRSGTTVTLDVPRGRRWKKA